MTARAKGSTPVLAEVLPQVPLTPPAQAPGWHGRLELRYRRDGSRTLAHDRHDGPLRVLQALYPEGPGICHHVLVHPPGGIVGGDRLAIDVELEAGAHALVTTPGATRFYRSDARAAAQTAKLRVGEGARLEWLPLETIAYPGCDATNEVRFELAPGASMIGWDLLALGLPASGAAFDRGRYHQHLEWPGLWLERGTLDAGDAALLGGPLGLDGQRALGTLWFAAAEPLAAGPRDALLEAAREVVAAGPLARLGGATAPRPGLVVLRLLASQVEPAWLAMRQVRAAWRHLSWGLQAEAPRVWRT